MVAVLLFRGQVSRWIDKLLERPPKELEVGTAGLKMKWDGLLQEAKVEVEPIRAAELTPGAEETPPETSSLERDFVDEMLDVANIAPSAAVLESYRRLELLLNELVALGRVQVPERRRPLSSRFLAQLAYRSDLISENELALYNDLATLRNAAAHQDEVIDFDRAAEYVRLAGVLFEAMSRLVQNENWEPGDR